MKFLAELRRRNVIRMAGLYLVGAWLAVQVAATLLPVFEAPGWVLRVLVALLAAGFVAALVFSWVYELTPEGLKRDADVSPAESIAPQTARRMDRMIIVALLLALGYFAVDRFVLAPGQGASEVPGSAAPVAGGEGPVADSAATPAAATVATGDASTPAGASAEQQPDQGAVAGGDNAAKPVVRGIAVLPFDNLSPDPDNAFFAGGVYEEVLTKLSRIGELRVISRTSMERIAEERLEVGAIGQRLGVTHVLEGSVRRAGDQIRVTVQLIEAAGDAQVWGENYDRTLDDVFAIQSEIAVAIADRLELTLSPELQANLGERPTQNPEAYALYLRALDDSRRWRGVDGYQTLIALLEPAVQLDTDFLAAKLLLVEAYGRMHWLRADPDGSFADKARALTAELTRRWPERPEAQLAQGQVHYNLERDYARALAAFQAVQARLPNDPAVLTAISASLKRLGRTDEFLRAAQTALVADPEAPRAHGEVYLALLFSGRYDEALAHAEHMKQKFPEDPTANSSLARIKLYRNQDIDAYLDFGKRAGPAVGEGLFELAIARFQSGDIDGALALFQVAEQSTTPGQAATLAAYRAEFLRLAGRESEADALARSAYAAIRQSTDVEKPRADIGAARWYANAALIAAQAGERAAAQRWRDLALASPALAIEDRSAVAGALSAAARALGDQEAAWQLQLPFVGNGLGRLPDAHLRVFKTFYDRLYGESASYRDYMAKFAAGTP